MINLNGATITVHKLEISNFGTDGIQFDADITASRPGWSWHWKSARCNSSPHSMSELRINPTIDGLVSMLNREAAEASKSVERQRIENPVQDRNNG